MKNTNKGFAMTTKERISKELKANEAISPNNLSLNAYVASVGGLSLYIERVKSIANESFTWYVDLMFSKMQVEFDKESLKLYFEKEEEECVTSIQVKSREEAVELAARIVEANS